MELARLSCVRRALWAGDAVGGRALRGEGWLVGAAKGARRSELIMDMYFSSRTSSPAARGLILFALLSAVRAQDTNLCQAGTMLQTLQTGDLERGENSSVYGCLEGSSGDTGAYNTIFNQPLSGADKSIVFTVRADGAHLAFFSAAQSTTGELSVELFDVSTKIYEIVLSSQGSAIRNPVNSGSTGSSEDFTMSMITDSSQLGNGYTLAEGGMVATPDILSDNENRSFWATSNLGLVVVGTGTVVGQNEIMHWQDPNYLLEPTYVGIMTGFGSTGDWNVCAVGWAGQECIDCANPCVDCPAGTTSGPGAVECTRCSAGEFAAERSSACTTCSPGTNDDDSDPSTPCTGCMAGTYSTAGAVECELLCSSDDLATLDSDCVGCDAGKYVAGMDCFDVITVHISIVDWGSEISWTFNDGETVGYTDDHNGELFFHEVAVAPEGTHTFTFADVWADGWHGGYWEILSACNHTIAGGPVDGQVDGAGGSFVFDGTSQCCSCEDTPDGCDSSSMPVSVMQLDMCVDCLAGTTSESRATECTSCSVGTFAAPGSSDGCVECAPGTYDNDADASTDCINCEPGQYQDAPRALDCLDTDCEPGSYSPAGRDSNDVEGCQICAPGTTDEDSNASTACTMCPSGTFSSVTGLVGSCAGVCPVGSYGPEGSASDQCEQCPPGATDEDSDAGTACTLCAAGMYASITGLVGNCTGICPAGSYAPPGSQGISTEDFQPVCTGSTTITVKIHIGTWGADIQWYFDENVVTEYSDNDNGNTFLYEYVLPFDGQKTFAFIDTWGDGWTDGGYWELLTQCGDTFAGGPEDGLVTDGSGGTYIFDSTAICCNVNCASCPAGQVDHDSNSGTKCAACSAGRYSSQTGIEGECLEWCPVGSYGPPAQASDQCQSCVPGKIDTFDVMLFPLSDLPSAQLRTACADLRCGETNGCAEPEYCAPLAELHEVSCCSDNEIDGWKAPGAASSPECLVWASRDPGGLCQHALNYDAATAFCNEFGGRLCTAAELEADCTSATGCGHDTDLVFSSTVRFNDPGTPCADCPAGQYSAQDGGTACFACTAGQYAPPGSDSVDDCEACGPGQVDTDGDPKTPCMRCPPGQYSNITARIGVCDLCPTGSSSVSVAGGSLSISDCKPSIAATWAPCEPCASTAAINASIPGDTLGIFARSELPFCVNDAIVKIHVVDWGGEYEWEIDGGGSFAYTNDHNGDVYFHTVGLSLAQEQHTFHFTDTWGDGWHGGYWELQNVCGETIGGGAVDGVVSGAGGSFDFSTADLCCDCKDDRDGILTAMFTSCVFLLARVNNDCGADVSDLLGLPFGTLTKHLCPVTCSTCNAEALNTTKRTCGLCPVGFQLDEISNTYTDYDECTQNAGGCDPLMGHYEDSSWKIEPCTNSQGGFKCNSCPDGFEQIGNSCELPDVLSAGNGLQSETSAVASVQPKSSLIIAGPPAALVAGSEQQAAFLDAVRVDIAASLGVDPSDIVLDNVDRGRRQRRLQDSVELQFDILFVNNSNAQDLVVAITSQLADPASPLMNAHTTSHLLADQVPEIVFVCPIGKVRPDGESLCRKCASPAFADSDGVTCTECPLYQIPTRRGDACMCDVGYYNASTVQPTCHADSFIEPLALDTTIECKPCLMDCVASCHGAELSVAVGWAPQARHDGKAVAIFQCKEPAACPGGKFSANNETLCTEGYTGVLCGACASDGYSLKEGKTCAPCGEMSTLGFVVTIVLIVLIIALAMNIRLVYNYFATLQQLVELMQELQLQAISKTVLATMQILGNLAINLQVVFPLNYKSFLSEIVSYFRFDITVLIMHLDFGCMSDGSYSHSLFGNCLLVVVVVVFVAVQFLYRERRDETAEISEEAREAQAKVLFEKFDLDHHGITVDELGLVVKRIHPEATPEQIKIIFAAADTDGGGSITFDEFYAAVRGGNTGEIDSGAGLDLGLVVKQHLRQTRVSNALTKVFLLVFILYPGLTNKIFEGLICRDLGGDPLTSVLAVDYRVDCEENMTSRYVRQMLLIVIWPVGLPTLLFLWMHHSKSLILARDHDTLEKFDFVMADYRPEYWYWEVVELSRKLILSGLIGLFGRGTIAQSFAAVIISCFFFALSLHARPFTTDNLNRIKVFSEFQIFGILLVCIVLQTNATGLPATGLATEEFYGNVQLVLTVAIMPMVLYIMGWHARELRREHKQLGLALRDKKRQVQVNPLNDDASLDLQ